MINDSEKIIEHYLTNNKVAITLDPADLLLLRKVLYDFIRAKGDLVSTSMLLAYCSNTLTSKNSFPKDLAKVSNKALAMILHIDHDDNGI
ncbi:hypothetical protein [Sphingobacterium chungjuense]|uniref:hypothetical protein n=1 Tax=Sphingobacterium chungjuense TaxID=2675553 RepID=UPI00140D5630|nr:hypothetical protein [Sphingobacterium chungjuense]